MVIELTDDTADMIAKLAVGSVLAFSEEIPRKKHFQDMLKATIEYLEQVMDPSIKSVTLYQELLKLLPEGVERIPPQRIQDFITAMSTGRF
jgi:uncharacterized protein Yka (UPF0111/DUF47 family)